MNYEVGIETKNKIIDTARRLFYEVGYEETTVALLAKEAGVKQGTLHYHFNSKKMLYDIIYRDIAEINYKEAEALVSTKSSLKTYIACNFVYWYKIFHDENYRRFVSIANSVLFKDDPLYYLEMFRQAYDFSPVTEFKEHDILSLLADMGGEDYIFSYVSKHIEDFDYEMVTEYCLRFYTPEYISKKLIDEVKSVIRKADMSFLKYTF